MARGIEHFLFGFWLGLLTSSVQKGDVAMVFSPLLTIRWVVCLIGKMKRLPIIVNIQDLFPREAVELGMLANPLLVRLFEAMERQVYSLAAGITEHSPGNKEHVIARTGKRTPVHVVGNCVDLDLIRPGPKDNAFSRRYGLGSKFVVSYAGTMGWAQDMRTIVRSAARLSDENQILFLLVGDGVEKQKAQALCRDMGLANIIWLPIQPWSVYPEILSASDVCLVNLHPELRTPASDRELVGKMGQRGRAYVERFFSRAASTGKMEAILKAALGEKT